MCGRWQSVCAECVCEMAECVWEMAECVWEMAECVCGRWQSVKNNLKIQVVLYSRMLILAVNIEPPML